jgi:AraC family transcriptional regulator
VNNSAIDAPMGRADRERDTRLPPVVVGGLAESKVRRVTAFIENNLHRELRLEELAAVTHMSPYYFARLFKRATGVSPHRFVVRRRIDAATALLTESTSSISSIARAVGFRTASHFATTVRRFTGMTPSAYRARRAAAEPPVETPPVVAADADEKIPTLPK